MIPENTNAIGKALSKLIEGKKYLAARDVLETMHAADIALMLEEYDLKTMLLLFRLLPKEIAAETFVGMDETSRENLIQSFSDSELKDVVDELYMDDAVDLIGEMPANVVKRILSQTDPEMRKMINEILKYPEDSAGSIMTTEYVSLRPDMTVEDAIKRIRRTGVDKETINTCYVTDDNRRLLGMVTVRSLLLSEETKEMAEIMHEEVKRALTTQDREEVARDFTKYDLSAMPVVDEENRLVGIVTFDDVMDVLQEETTEDIEKMAAITPSDRPYLKAAVFETYKSRIPWLLLLMISATFTGLIISGFENALAAQTILVAFIPMLMDTGGNCGSQASVTIIRGLSLGEIEFKDVLKVVWKETRVALLCGLTLAVATFIKMLLIDRTELLVATVVCTTLMMTVVVAKIVGSILPMAASKIKLDPAVMASPFITTIVDAISLIIYFKIATLLLGI